MLQHARDRSLKPALNSDESRLRKFAGQTLCQPDVGVTFVDIMPRKDGSMFRTISLDEFWEQSGFKFRALCHFDNPRKYGCLFDRYMDARIRGENVSKPMGSRTTRPDHKDFEGPGRTGIRESPKESRSADRQRRGG